MNKKIFASLLLVFLIALSVSAVSAAEDAGDIVAADDAVDDLAVSEELDVVEATQTPATADYDGINNAVNSSQDGDTIDLSGFDTYDVGNKTVTIAKKNLVIKGNGATTIKGTGDGNGIFYIQATGVTIQGIKFVDTNPNSQLNYYDDSTKDANCVLGYGVYFMQNKASNGVVDNCSFINFNHGVRIQGGAENVVVKNSYFTGVTNYLRNDPTVNVEKGTKAIGIMGSKGAQIINNTFEGPVLDAVSIASSSSGCSVINNTFIGNSYSIYFGGAATPGSVIKGNKFKNIGHYQGVDNKTGDFVEWNKLPIISLEKSASDLLIEENTFEVINDNIIIAAEAGNAAHGYPSEIGGITVTKNTVQAYETGVNVASTVLMHVLSRGGELNPTAAITVTNNTLNGATPFVYWNVAWGDEDGNVVIPAGDKAATYFKITSITPAALTGVLIDLNGAGVYKTTTIGQGKNAQTVISGETYIYNMNGVNTTAETDEDGVFTIANPTGNITLYFLGTSKLAPTTLDVNYEAPVVPTIEPVYTTLVADDITIKAGNSGNIVATLSDINGTPIANKTIAIQIDGEPVFIGQTDASGKISAAVKFASAGTKYAYLSFIDETGAYVSSLENVKITVNKKATALTAAKKATLKVKKAKKIKVTLKSEGKVLANKKITIKVSGKTFSAKTNSKGVATISVKLTKKGKPTATVSFAGDGAYKAASAKIKFTVKK